MFETRKHSRVAALQEESPAALQGALCAWPGCTINSPTTCHTLKNKPPQASQIWVLLGHAGAAMGISLPSSLPFLCVHPSPALQTPDQPSSPSSHTSQSIRYPLTCHTAADQQHGSSLLIISSLSALQHYKLSLSERVISKRDSFYCISLSFTHKTMPFHLPEALLVKLLVREQRKCLLRCQRR